MPTSRTVALKGVSAVLFDLDGTFADTAPDMARALNVLRSNHGLEALSVASARSHVSRGARGMIDVGFGIGPADPRFVPLRDAFYDEYQGNICIESKLFDGMELLIHAMEKRSIAWGIVTNKAARFALPIAETLGFATRAACIVCGDTTPHIKPHPAPLRHAAELIGVAPQDCIYVGDDERDIQAAHAAGMRGVAATYGYIGAETDSKDWGAEYSINSPIELQSLLFGEN
ncbi:MAG: HAD-IA family hydrolase [Usitatibacteraceae bacterium]